MTPEEFAAATSVSRETLDQLRAHVDLLRKWQTRINLIGDRTALDVWNRHVMDSAQLFPFIRVGSSIADVGSGAGFPGLVLSIMGLPNVSLIESDTRKAVFLREAIRITGAPASVLNRRVDDLESAPFDVIVARAFAPLARLLASVARLIGPSTALLLLKGQDIESELTEASKYWKMTTEVLSSATDPSGRILLIREINHV
ncbi:MAG: 16S rRNA (guanine(527)-N(7))-methyltransferase RsmG [Alphaproteobacteria bacterium]|nr:16S rRNA (guanine(527)-N(7))-methyltransferase RsmG [Alphaproteobacteria bacterium]